MKTSPSEANIIVVGPLNILHLRSSFRIVFTFPEMWRLFDSSCRGYTCSVEFTIIGQCMWTWLPSRYLLQDVTSEPHPLPVGCYTRVCNCCVNQDSSVGIVTRLQARRTGSWIHNKDRRSFSSPKRPHWLWGSPSLLLQWVLVFFREVERRGREAGHLLPSSPEVKIVWSYVAPPALCPMTCTGTACVIFNSDFCSEGAHVGAVGWGTALQAGRSQVRFPMVSLEFFFDMIRLAALWPWGRLNL
jgi:hypothetical protein